MRGTARRKWSEDGNSCHSWPEERAIIAEDKSRAVVATCEAAEVED